MQTINLGTAPDAGDGDKLRVAYGKANGNFAEQAALIALCETLAHKGAANGYAGLDAGGKISALNLPAIAIIDRFVVASQAAMLALTAERGDVAIRTDLNKTFILGTDDPTVLANWSELLTPTDSVSSIAGLVGAITAAALKTAIAIVVADIGDMTANGRSFVQAANYAAMKALLSLVKADVGLGSVDNTTDAAKPVSTATQTALDLKQSLSEKGNANGYASVGSDGKIPSSLLPASVVGDVQYQGTWNATTNTPTIPAAAAGNKGQYYIVSTAGTTSIDGIAEWALGDWIISSGAAWSKVDNTDAVISVAGLLGVITAAALKTALGLVKADVGLGSVDNTSDAGKPLSTAATAALAAKAPSASPSFTGQVNSAPGTAVGTAGHVITNSGTALKATHANANFVFSFGTNATTGTPFNAFHAEHSATAATMKNSGQGVRGMYAAWDGATYDMIVNGVATANADFSSTVLAFRFDTSGGIFMPSVGTTASAANAFFNNATSPANLLLRSTSSIRYKRDVEDLDVIHAEAILKLRPVWYRSTASADRPDWSFYGFTAEAVADVDPRLVHFGYRPEDYEQKFVPVPGADPAEEAGSLQWVLKEGAKLVPDGVQYERLTVLLLAVAKRHDEEIKALQAALRKKGK